MGECAKIGRVRTAMYGPEALCNLRVLGEGPGRVESRKHQEKDVLWIIWSKKRSQSDKDKIGCVQAVFMCCRGPCIKTDIWEHTWPIRSQHFLDQI
ncbi:hypothetical protein F2Q69_00047057 [Brassica cretica]|uniref:Uncharacterized protein n=1 Tax=Brassica cretica TaxID=69181 RepID=A0A8S9Q045_BRACR|nr:hypothetical protein F2Q69_00047057 [Brassica cretica]